MELMSEKKKKNLLGKYHYYDNFSLGCFGNKYKAFYLGDFIHAQDEKIGHFLFEYDNELDKFVLPIDNEIAYDAWTVLYDNSFLIFEVE